MSITHDSSDDSEPTPKVEPLLPAQLRMKTVLELKAESLIRAFLQTFNSHSLAEQFKAMNASSVLLEFLKEKQTLVYLTRPNAFS